MLWFHSRSIDQNVNDKRTLRNVDDYLRQRFIYLDEAIETLQTPEYMLGGLEMTGKLTGDCDDISTLHAAFLTCLRFSVRFVAIRSNFTDPNFDHVFIEAKSNGEWIPYDVTIPLGTQINYFGRLTIQV
ncbi:transglutaminase domain-containing protein [bacterium]|nr:transglutaminase domain-containing protein [bacterium]